jgi:pyruvate/2-oxoglutarate/acetoin dehydrogenase E1 component
MAIKTIRDAINDCLHQEMARDETVIVLGEDVSGGAGAPGVRDAAGGVFGVTTGLHPKYGENRVIDTPISESAIVGAAAGAALAGLRPVAEIMFADFLGVCLDQFMNQAAKFNYMFGGKAKTPMVVRMTMGAGMSAAAQHSQSPYNIITAIPGLKCALPSNAYDAKGLLASAIRGEDPVVFMEHKMLYGESCEVPDESYTIPFGKGNMTRQGGDVTIVAFARMLHFANAVADKLSKDGIRCDVIDPRTTSPLDEEMILESVRQTGRLVVVDESPKRCGMASDIAGIVSSQAFEFLDAPIKLITPPHTPIPFAPNLERLYLPSLETIERAVRDAMEGV